MKIGILSDTHDRLARTRQAIERLRDAGATALVHCGDITRAEIVEACAVLPFTFVFGNNDSDTVSELERAAADTGSLCLGWGDMIELAGKRIGIAHGHLGTDIRRLLAVSPDYLLSGHSHIALDVRQGTVRRINPGALHSADKYSVAVLDLETDELRFISVPS